MNDVAVFKRLHIIIESYKSYYFYNDLINVLNFEANNLKIDKRSWKNLLGWLC